MSTHVWRAPATGHVTEVAWDRMASVRVGVVLWGGLAMVDGAALIPLPSYAALAAVALLVTACSVGTHIHTALAAALVGWLVVNGFVVHRLGVLGFDGTPDLARLGLLSGLALTAARARR